MIWRGKRWDELDQETQAALMRFEASLHPVGSRSKPCGRGCSDSWATWGRVSQAHLHPLEGLSGCSKRCLDRAITGPGELVVLDWPFRGENQLRTGA